jgi:SAM-dependent methyltransferase
MDRLTDRLAEPADPAEAAQIACWNDRAGRSWTALQARTDAIFEGFTAMALDEAAPAPGERVLDIGSGCGATLIELARRVGPHGHVLGVDVSRPMSERALQRLRAAGMGNAEILLADAATYPFPPGERDLLFSRHGLMFFADPVGAFRNLQRAMRAEGRLFGVAWRALAENDWFRVPLEAARHLLPPLPPADPHAPGPFAFADADHVRGILQTSGWRQGELRRRDVTLRVAESGGAAEAARLLTRIGPLAQLIGLSGAGDALKAAVTEAVTAALRAYETEGAVMLGASLWFISARA